MRTLMFLLMMASLSCGAQDKSMTAEIRIQQEDMVKLVHSNDVMGVRHALERGISVNIQDVEKRNLLLLATINRQVEMAKLLVENGADVNMQANNQDSPFLYAGASGQTELVRLFLANGARFDIFNRYHGTALIPACERGHVATVRLLVKAKDFPIDHVNRLRWTALMEAVVLGDGTEKYQEIIQLLKNAGADLEIPDKDGITALQHARNRGFEEIVTLLSN